MHTFRMFTLIPEYTIDRHEVTKLKDNAKIKKLLS